jgi:hypothetical protein
MLINAISRNESKTKKSDPRRFGIFVAFSKAKIASRHFFFFCVPKRSRNRDFHQTNFRSFTTKQAVHSHVDKKFCDVWSKVNVGLKSGWLAAALERCCSTIRQEEGWFSVWNRFLLSICVDVWRRKRRNATSQWCCASNATRV